MFNVINDLERCFKSLIHQSYEHLEIIAVNDGSTDGSGELCDRYQKRDSRMKVIHQSNQGLSAARNTALEAATGDWIGFVDGDDYIAPHMYSRLMELVQTHHGEIAICRIQAIEKNEMNEEFYAANPLNTLNTTAQVITGYDAVKSCLLDFNDTNRINMGVCNKLYHRRLWEDLRFPLHRYFEDSFVTIRLLDKVSTAVTCSEKLYYYVQRSDSISHRAPCYVDLLDGSEDWYSYIAQKHPGLEPQARRKLLTLFLIFAEHIIEIGNAREIDQLLPMIQKKLADHEYSQCGLSAQQTRAVQLLLKSTRAFYIALKTCEG